MEDRCDVIVKHLPDPEAMRPVYTWALEVRADNDFVYIREFDTDAEFAMVLRDLRKAFPEAEVVDF